MQANSIIPYCRKHADTTVGCMEFPRRTLEVHVEGVARDVMCCTKESVRLVSGADFSFIGLLKCCWLCWIVTEVAISFVYHDFERRSSVWAAVCTEADGQ